jgi:hypothetical protein
MILDLHGPTPELGKWSGECARHEVGAATRPERLDQQHPAGHGSLRGWRNESRGATGLIAARRAPSMIVVLVGSRLGRGYEFRGGRAEDLDAMLLGGRR